MPPDVHHHDLYCPSCGYNQRGISALRCPECGATHADAPPSPIRIPWNHRKHLGLLHAYRKTAYLLLLHPKQLILEIHHPIPLPDAKRFWLLTIALAYSPFLLATIALYFSLSPADRYASGFFTPLYSPVPPAVSLHVGVLLFLTFATGLPSYFCHPPRLPIPIQNRAIALSYYTSAPLAFFPFTLIPVLLATALNRYSLPGATSATLLAVSFALFVLALTDYRTISIIATITGRRPFSLALLLLPSQFLIAILTLILTPLLLHYTFMLLSSML